MFNEIAASLRRGTFRERVKQELLDFPYSVFHLLGFYYIRNKDVARSAKESSLYRRLERKYRRVLEAGAPSGEQRRSNKIWVCWFQGFDSAPAIVKACLNSLKRNLGKDHEIVVLDDTNLRDYVQLPDYIEEKRRSGKLPMAQYSDIVRLALLCEYGGLWIDSTVLCTSAELMPVIDRAPLFAFKAKALGTRDVSPIVASNWLIGAVSNHPILLLTQKLLYEYWKDAPGLRYYFLFHLFFAMAARRYPDEWKRVPLYNNISPHILKAEITEPFSEERWRQILGFSAFHKLNHRYNFAEDDSTFFAHILEEYRNP